MEAAPTAIAILFITLYLVISQRQKLGIGGSASVGAILALATGIVSWQDILEVWGIVGNSTLSLFAVVIIALVMDEAGCFRSLALSLTRLGIGISRIFFPLLILMGAILTAVFSNYGTTLIWTPILIEILLVLSFSPTAVLTFLLSTSFIVDAASLPLPMSNLINLFTVDAFNISSLRYLLVMVPVNGIAIAASLAVTWFYFNRYIPKTYSLARLQASQSTIVCDPLVSRWSLPILGLVLSSYLFTKPLGIPISAVASLGALLMLGLAGRWFQSRPPIISVQQVLQQAPWQIIFFSLGMQIVVLGLRNTDLTSLLSPVLEQFSLWGLTVATTGTGFLAMLLSSVLNNFPTALIHTLAIQNATSIEPTTREAMVYASVIGCNIGGKLTPIGSLSTLLWLEMLARKKLSFPPGQYLRIHLALTIPVLFLTLLGLAMWLPWLIA